MSGSFAFNASANASTVFASATCFTVIWEAVAASPSTSPEYESAALR